MLYVKLLTFIFLFVIFGCNVEKPELDPRITEDDLLNDGKILSSLSGVQLIDPITSPGYKKNPTIRVSGVKPDSTVSVYLTSACSTPIVSKYTSSSIVDIQIPSLSEGVYNFYVKQSNSYTSSSCTRYPLQYQYEDSLPPPNFIELDQNFTTPSLDPMPRFLIKGVTSGSTVSIFADEDCSISLGSQTAYGSNVIVGVNPPGLNPGTYKIYTNQIFNGETSNCSDVYSQYQLTSEVAAPNSVVLENPNYTPSSNNKPTIKISGVTAGYEVSLYRDPNCVLLLGSKTATSPVVSITVSEELPDGIYQFFSLQKNLSNGKKSECSTVAASYEIDSETKDISGIALINPTSTPSNDSTPQFRVYGVENYATLYLYRDPSCLSGIGSKSTSNTGYVDITTNVLSEGSTNIYAKQIDTSGNHSSCVGPLLNYIYDKTISTPTGLSLKSPNFSPNTDSTPTIKVDGVEVGATVRIYEDSSCLTQRGSAVATGNSVDVTSSALSSNVNYTFYAKQVDKAGNTSNCSTSNVSYQVLGSTVAEPSSIALTSPAQNPSNSTSIEVSVSGLEIGGYVYLFSDSNCNSLVVSEPSAGSTHYFNVTGLSEGTYTYYARQASSQGQFSDCSNASLTYTVDLSAQKPSALSLYSPTSSPSGDVTPTIKVDGVEVGSTVKLYKDSSCISQIGSAVATTTSVNVTGSLTQSGTYSLYVKQVDKFGNISPCSTAFANYVLIIDGSTPTAVTMVSPAANEGNDTTPTIRVDGVTLGATVYAYSNASCTNVVASGIATDTYINLTVGEIATGDGNYKYYARQEINGGLSGCSSNPADYRLDTVANAPTSVSMISPLISPSSDNTPTIRVSPVEVNATVKIYSNSSCTTKVGESIATSTSIDVTLDALTDSSYDFYAKQTDAVGNNSNCSSVKASYVLDTGAATPSSITLFDPVSSPSTDDTPEFTVFGVENGSTVSVHTSNTCSNASKVGQAISSGSSVVVEVSPALSAGVYNIYAKQTDILGNISGCSTANVNYQVTSSGGSSDPLYADQWYLNNNGTVTSGPSGEDINVDGVWATNKGSNVHVRIVDDGLQIAHPDLAINIKAGASWDFIGNDTDPTPSSSYDSHGTSCGGVIAAKDNNNIGVRGVAPAAKISGYNLLQTSTFSAEALSMSQNISTVDVSSNSWGPADGYGLFYEPSNTFTSAIETGLSSGRGGKGTVYVWAAGNGATVDNSNYDGYANFYGVMAVCGTTYNGTFAEYSESGANLWVCAPTANLAHQAGRAIATTDLTGNSGQNTNSSSNDFTDKDYTKYFGGTSAAAPVVSGVAALVIKANPNLSWRDVKLVLAQSARKNDPGNSLGSPNTWQTNAAGFSFNEDYGFGVVDADAAVTLAASWTNVGSLKTDTFNIPVDQILPNNSQVTSSHTVSSPNVTKIEFVEVRANISHSDWGELEIILESPGGLESKLTRPHDCYNNSSQIIPCTVPTLEGSLINSFRFGAAKYMGENPSGTWKLKVRDSVSTGGNAIGNFNSWTLKFYGE